LPMAAGARGGAGALSNTEEAFLPTRPPVRTTTADPGSLTTRSTAAAGVDRPLTRHMTAPSSSLLAAIPPLTNLPSSATSPSAPAAAAGDGGSRSAGVLTRGASLAAAGQVILSGDADLEVVEDEDWEESDLFRVTQERAEAVLASRAAAGGPPAFRLPPGDR
jgi:hypothetical protein